MSSDPKIRERRQSFLNRSECKKFALDFAQKNRAHKFTRVSDEFLEMLEGTVRSKIISHVMSLPSKGQTIR